MSETTVTKRAFEDFPEDYILAGEDLGGLFRLNDFVVPRTERGKGNGRAFYEAFETWLIRDQKKSTIVRLFAADEGSGPSGGFWEKMGFLWESGEGDGDRGYMRKVVRPLERAGADDDEEPQDAESAWTLNDSRDQYR